MVASVPLMNKNGGTIGFTMKHALTKVTLVLKNTDVSATMKPTSIIIHSRNEGVLTFNESGFSWGNISGEGTQGEYFGTDPIGPFGESRVKPFYLLPDNSGGSIHLVYTVTPGVPGGGNISNEIIADAPIPPSPAWEPGRPVTYNILLTTEGIKTITAEVGTDWVQGSESIGEFGPPYNGKAPNLLAIPGKTAYWVAPEDANGGNLIPWNANLNELCPAGWHVPTKEEFLDMTGQKAGHDYNTRNYALIAAAFPTGNGYWSTTEATTAFVWFLDVDRSGRTAVTTLQKPVISRVRCVMAK